MDFSSLPLEPKKKKKDYEWNPSPPHGNVRMVDKKNKESVEASKGAFRSKSGSVIIMSILKVGGVMHEAVECSLKLVGVV